MHQIFLEVPETHRNILDQLGGLDTPIGGAWVAKIQAELNKYMREGVNISAFIRASCTNFLEVPEIHRNIFRPLERC